jgi:cytochrome P450
MATTTNDLQIDKTTPKTLPPGPRKLPYVGNLLSLRRNPPEYLQQLHRRYGDMATLHLGKTRVVALFRPEYVRYVLVEHPGNFSNQGAVPPDGNGANEGLLTIDGEKHRQQRRAVQPAFHKKIVEGYAAVIDEYTRELFNTWHVAASVDLSRAMQELTLRIVSKCLFSVDLSRQLAPLADAFNAFLGSQASAAEDLLNIRIDNPITGYGKRRAAMRQLNMLIYTLIAQRRASEDTHNDVLSMLMTGASGDPEQPMLTDKQIHDHVLTFLAAGHETTANAVAWSVYLLSQYPAMREKLQEEIRTVLAGRAPTVEDIGKMPYLDWVLSEALRLFPPAWMQLRFVAKDFELDGVHLPAGTLLMLSQWVIQRAPEIWDEPDEFRPERWNPSNGEQVPPGAYFPFGGGPRICIGMPFAQLEAKMILASLYQRYMPQPAPDYRPGLKPLITLRPKNNLRVTLLPVNSSAEVQWKRIASPVLDGSERQGCLPALLSLFGLLP